MVALEGLAARAVNATQDAMKVAAYAGAGTLEEAHHELYRISPEVSPVHLAYTLISIFTVVFGTFSAFIKEQLYAGEAIIATCIGIGFGPYGANIFSPTDWAGGRHVDEITIEVTRVVIALSVFGVGVELPRAYVWKHWRSLAILLGPTMLCGWMFSGLFIWGLIPRLTFLDALVIAACVTPTDPILAASVVGKGKFAQEHVPAHIRHILQAESGSNDGAAFPFLYFAMFWLLRESQSVGHAIGWWVVLVVLYQIVLGVLIGAAVGIMARKAMKFAKYRDLIDRESMVAMYVALALLVTGATTLAGSDDLLAAFACGTAFAWDDWFSESIEDSNFSSILDLLVNCAIFFYIGATIPFDLWNSDELTITPWRLVVIGILILLFRRIPVIFLLQKFMPDIRTMREAIFVGHFGPMGVGALFISTLARSRLPTATYPPETDLDVLALSIEPIVYFIILCSVLVHGLSIPVFTNGKRLHKRVSSFSRTFTAGSTVGGDGEPSWLSRVRRVGDPPKNSAEDEKQLAATRSSSQLEPSSSQPSDEPGQSTPSSTDAEKGKRENMASVDEHDRTPSSNNTDSVDGPQAEVWDEGNKIIHESASGENIRVEQAGGQDAAGPSSHHMPFLGMLESAKKSKESVRRSMESQRSQRSQRSHEAPGATSTTPVDQSQSQDYFSKNGESREQARPSYRKAVSVNRLWKRDEQTGQPRELNEREKRIAKKERDVRRERHFCNRDNFAHWREGNKIVVEKDDGEVVAIRDVPEGERDEEEGDPNRFKSMMHAIPRMNRMASSDPRGMPQSSGNAIATSNESRGTDEELRQIEEGRGDGSTSQAMPPAGERTTSPGTTGFNRPVMKSLNTAALKDKLLRRHALDEGAENQSAPSTRGGPEMTERRRIDSEPRTGSIRFNLPHDDEVRRYDLDT